MIKPIKPSEIVEKKKESLPDFVIESFNELIAEKWDGNQATFTAEEVKDRIRTKAFSSFDEKNRKKNVNQWLNVEPIYRLEGWKVLFESPDMTEQFDSYFKFYLR